MGDIGGENKRERWMELHGKKRERGETMNNKLLEYFFSFFFLLFKSNQPIKEVTCGQNC